MNDKIANVKIFCIGWHKTGTTSIGEALLILGYKVVGARLDLAGPLLKGDINPILEVAREFDAFQDVPWAALYRELDKHFPGGKFILIERDENKWLESAFKHFGDRNVEMHEWLYGSGNIVGNEDSYLERYRRHLAEVKEYFISRPGDLLVMSLEKGDGWEKLCPFLGMHIPKKAFPYANKGMHNYTHWERVYSYLRGKMPTEARRKILDLIGVADKRNRFNNFEENKKGNRGR